METPLQIIQGLSWLAWSSLAISVLIFVVLMKRRNVPPELLFLGGMVGLALIGAISPKEAMAGFANESVIVIGSLFVVTTGLRTTGVLDWMGHNLLGAVRHLRQALPRIAGAEIVLSAFVPNTPVVALFVPLVVDWCRKNRVSPSRLLLPVSYFAVLGGVCSLVGTSTNMVTQGELRKAAQVAEDRAGTPLAYPAGFAEELHEMSMFEIGYVGLPCAIVGGLIVMITAAKWLPDRADLLEKLGGELREYMVEMLVQPGCRLIGQSVEQAGLRHLPGLFLIEIDRRGEVITPVTPEDVIQQKDRLIFTGVVTTILDLERIPGLVPAADLTYDVSAKARQGRHLTEVVLSPSSPLIGETIRAANFRQRYNAAVVAVHRNGSRLKTKLGDIELEPGDTLLLQTRSEFADDYRHSRDFYLVSRVEGSRPRRHDRTGIAALLFITLIVWLTIGSFGWLPATTGLGSPAVATLAIAGLFVVTRCLPLADARSALDFQVLFTIAGAVGLGKALENTGAAEAIAKIILYVVGDKNEFLLLACIYIMTLILTELLSNAAVVLMMFPVVIALTAHGELSPRPFIMGITLASSLSFLTPVGYQTNLMVMGPGGYRPGDYLRMGAPLTLSCTIIALLLIPLVWPFAL